MKFVGLIAQSIAFGCSGYRPKSASVSDERSTLPFELREEFSPSTLAIRRRIRVYLDQESALTLLRSAINCAITPSLNK